MFIFCFSIPLFSEVAIVFPLGFLLSFSINLFFQSGFYQEKGDSEAVMIDFNSDTKEEEEDDKDKDDEEEKKEDGKDLQALLDEANFQASRADEFDGKRQACKRRRYEQKRL